MPYSLGNSSHLCGALCVFTELLSSLALLFEWPSCIASASVDRNALCSGMASYLYVLLIFSLSLWSPPVGVGAPRRDLCGLLRN